METILSEVYTFTPQDDKTNHIVPFQVPEGYDVLQCACSFSPKAVEDQELCRQAFAANIGKFVPRESIEDHSFRDFSLVNHLTFSLDCGERYIGCAHRHAATATHVISGVGSSPGFVRQRAEAGEWRAVINLHSITSPAVKYSLTITAMTQGEYENGL